MKFYLNIYEGFKNFASNTNHAYISFIYLIYFFRSLTLPISLLASPSFPPPQQPRLSSFASLPKVRQALESIKYWIVVIIFSSISIILFLYSNEIFFVYLKIHQNLISEYLKICFLKCRAYGAYIKSEYINVFVTSVFFSFLFPFYLYTVVLIGLTESFLGRNISTKV